MESIIIMYSLPLGMEADPKQVLGLYDKINPLALNDTFR